LAHRTSCDDGKFHEKVNKLPFNGKIRKPRPRHFRGGATKERMKKEKREYNLPKKKEEVVIVATTKGVKPLKPGYRSKGGKETAIVKKASMSLVFRAGGGEGERLEKETAPSKEGETKKERTWR